MNSYFVHLGNQKHQSVTALNIKEKQKTIKTLQRKYLFIWNFERYCNFVAQKDRFLLISFRMGFKFVVVIESLLDFKSEARCFEVRSCCQVVVIVKNNVDSYVTCEALVNQIQIPLVFEFDFLFGDVYFFLSTKIELT